MELPELSMIPVCPAASPIAGACASQQGVTCRVMRRDHEEDKGLDMSAAASGFIQHEAEGGVYLNLKSDPNTVTQFCYGDAVPVVGDADVPGGRASYTYCPVWQAEQLRIEEGRDELLRAVEPESVSAGMSSADYEDPWRQARADLEMFGEAA